MVLGQEKLRRRRLSKFCNCYSSQTTTVHPSIVLACLLLHVILLFATIQREIPNNLSVSHQEHILCFLLLEVVAAELDRRSIPYSFQKKTYESYFIYPVKFGLFRILVVRAMCFQTDISSPVLASEIFFQVKIVLRSNIPIRVITDETFSSY